jgi:hypothetical protein
MKKPSLFIAGNSKSGTTALHSFLSQHPDIFMAVPKEPNYFAKDFCHDTDPQRCFYRRTEAEYLDLYASARPDQVCGEASACYIYSQVAAAEIAQFNPAAKLIFILREPVSFLRSYHLQLLKNTPQDGETVKDFAKALALEPERKQGKKIPSQCLIPEFLYYTERVKYAQQLQRFYQHFPPEQIKVFIYDDWMNDNSAVYRDILAWVGLDPSYEPAFDVHNKGGVQLKSKAMQGLVADISHGKGLFAPAKQLVATVVPQQTRRAAVDWAYGNLAFAQAKPLDPDLKRRLKQAFLPEVVALGQLLDRNLVSLWGYDALA